jgi:hypothetical protein
MKKIIFALALVPFFAFQCKKDNLNKCLKGKVIRITCASYVIQVLNDNSIGEDQWKDSFAQEEKVYDNVFTASNKCKIPLSYKAGDIIFFNLDKPNPDDCVICTMYDAPPQVKFQIKNISSAPCE